MTRADDPVAFVGLVVFCALLALLARTDLRTGLLPDRLVLSLAFVGLAFVLAGYFAAPLSAFAGALLGGGLLFAVRALSRGGMGGGDVKLAAALGIWTGLTGILPALFTAFLLGSLWGIVLLCKGRGRRAQLPFGPCLAIGGLVGVLFGDAIAAAYEALL